MSKRKNQWILLKGEIQGVGGGNCWGSSSRAGLEMRFNLLSVSLSQLGQHELSLTQSPGVSPGEQWVTLERERTVWDGTAQQQNHGNSH